MCSVCKRTDRIFSDDRASCEICLEKSRTHYALNKEKYNARNAKYRESNKDIIKINNKRYRQSNDYNSKYQRDNKKILNEKKKVYVRNRYAKDPAFRLKTNLYQRINKELRGGISTTLANLLPYTMSELKCHLETLFEPWMTWQNHGKYIKSKWNDNDKSTWTWQVDHIIPHSKLKYKSINDENFSKCWSLSNLRPYPSKSNILDGNKRSERADT